MLVIYDFIRSLFDKYGKIQFTSMVVHDIRLYFPIRKTQVEITSRKSMIKKEMQNFKYISTFDD
jgi:hypothetical protein